MAITRSSAIGTERLQAPHYHGRHAANRSKVDWTSTRTLLRWISHLPYVLHPLLAAQRAATSHYYNGKRYYHGYSPYAYSRPL